jgi:hypothetical protein
MLTTQLERLEELWARLQGLGLADDGAAPEPFPHGTLSAKAVTPPSASRCRTLYFNAAH